MIDKERINEINNRYYDDMSVKECEKMKCKDYVVVDDLLKELDYVMDTLNHSVEHDRLLNLYLRLMGDYNDIKK